MFKQFEKSGEFFCFAGQLNQAVTGMFNLYRASQVLFQEEKILEDAKNFSAEYLTKKRAANELLDKWIITKDLPGEVSSNFIPTDFWRLRVYFRTRSVFNKLLECKCSCQVKTL